MVNLHQVDARIVIELFEIKLNLSHLWALGKIIKGQGIPEECNILLPGLERRGLILKGKATEAGEKFYRDLSEGSKASEVVITTLKSVGKMFEDVFDEWWNAFPRNNTFEYKGKHFQGTRALRSGKKEKNREEFMKILAKGEYTGKQLVKALQYQVWSMKEESVRTGENKLQYMRASLAYLNNAVYESFIDMEIPGTSEDRRKPDIIGI